MLLESNSTKEIRILEGDASSENPRWQAETPGATANGVGILKQTNERP